MCLNSDDCSKDFEVYRDTCATERTVTESNGALELSDCTEYYDPVLKDDALTYNETAYLANFPPDMTSLPPGDVQQLPPESVLENSKIRGKYMEATWGSEYQSLV